MDGNHSKQERSYRLPCLRRFAHRSLVDLADLYDLEGKETAAVALRARAKSLKELERAKQKRFDEDPLRAIVEEALETKEKEFGPNAPAVAETAMAMGNMFLAHKRAEDALNMYNRALEIRRKAFGLNSLAVADTLGMIALVYMADNQLNGAEESLKQALAINSKHNNLSEIVTLLGLLYTVSIQEEKYKQAEDWQRRS